MNDDEHGPSPLRAGAIKGPKDNPKREDLQRKPDPKPVVVEDKVPDLEPKPDAVDLKAAGVEEDNLSDTERIQVDIDRLSKADRTPLTTEQKAELYEIGLKNAGVSQEKARKVMDNMLFKGCHEEEYTIGGKLKIKLRTRNYHDVQRALRFAEAEAPRLPLHIDDLLCRYNLAASLSQYHDTVFKFVDTDEEREKLFDIRYSYIMGLVTPIAGRLNSCLMEFDTMMNVVLADGAPENF